MMEMREMRLTGGIFQASVTLATTALFSLLSYQWQIEKYQIAPKVFVVLVRFISKHNMWNLGLS